MNKFAKLTAGVMAFAMVFSMAACGSNNGGSSSGSSETQAATSAATTAAAKNSADDALKGILDCFVKDDTYSMYKTYYPDAKFEEKATDDGITISISGTDSMDGVFEFPAKDGYLNYEIKNDGSQGPMIFSLLVKCVGEYYGISPRLFSGYVNGLGINNIESDVYKAVRNEDGTGSMSVYYASKPEMKELDQLYINEAALTDFDENTQQFSNTVGKIYEMGFNDNNIGSLKFAVGEYGDKNTELTYNSIVETVKHFKPAGYEDFLNTDFNELKEISNDKYTVSTNAEEFLSEYQINADGYKFYLITFGSDDNSEGGEVVENAEGAETAETAAAE